MKSDLRFVNDNSVGITRIRFRNKFYYKDVDGNRIVDQDELTRIKALVIPPAWNDVWISPLKNGHIQATGRDNKLRKQYRYHQLWREIRDVEKYNHMIDFGSALPLIRERVEAALSLPGLPQEKVIATIICLLQHTKIRIGNDEYAKQNKSYGLTTLRNKHIVIDGSKMCFHFRGKSGVEHTINLSDRRLARIVKNIKDLPGQDLFQYLDDEGNRQTINSSHVNDYLRELTGENYTAKDFRTWYGTIEAVTALMSFEHYEEETQAKHNLVEAMKLVSKKLGNTPAICRKSYVHPLVISTYLDGSLIDFVKLSTLSSAIDSTDMEISREVASHDLINLNAINLNAINLKTLSEMETVILDFLQQNAKPQTLKR